MATSPQASLWYLYLPGGPENDGFLFLDLVNGDRISIDLTPPKIRMLLVLAEAVQSDSATIPPPARGWRRPERLIELIHQAFPNTHRVEKETIPHRVSQLKAAIHEAVQAVRPQEPVPALLENRRGYGYRLATTLQISADPPPPGTGRPIL